jgi:hypothetical protein
MSVLKVHTLHRLSAAKSAFSAPMQAKAVNMTSNSRVQSVTMAAVSVRTRSSELVHIDIFVGTDPDPAAF